MSRKRNGSSSTSPRPPGSGSGVDAVQGSMSRLNLSRLNRSNSSGFGHSPIGPPASADYPSSIAPNSGSISRNAQYNAFMNGTDSIEPVRSVKGSTHSHSSSSLNDSPKSKRSGSKAQPFTTRTDYIDARGQMIRPSELR